jgi:hypothetical protein
MAVVGDAYHILPECDLRADCEAFCQRNVHKPRLNPLSVATVVRNHAPWCTLSLPPRLRRRCHQRLPTAQLAADRAAEEPCPTRSRAKPESMCPCQERARWLSLEKKATWHGAVGIRLLWFRYNLRANTQSPNRANGLRFLASHALGTCDFSPDVARSMQNRECTCQQ